MLIFIGGSSEKKALMSKVASWIGDKTREEVLRWDMEEAFPLGKSSWQSLIDIANRVHAAVFIMTPDDLTWHRNSLLAKARDNVILEYGLFTGVLGTSKVIMCVDRDTSLASDVKGIVYASLENINSARRSIELWVEGLLNENNNMTKYEAEQIYVSLIRILKNSGINSADIEYWSAVYDHDQTRINLAIQSGADKNKTVQTILNEHNAKMLNNKDYLALISKLRAGSLN